jgi:hypothetical protein
MSVLGGIGKALSSVNDKAKKAGAIKKVSLKLKFNPPDVPKPATNGKD